ncbi:MAG: hypothetical protein WDN46_19660 [Methylocella sp.]
MSKTIVSPNKLEEFVEGLIGEVGLKPKQRSNIHIVEIYHLI